MVPFRLTNASPVFMRAMNYLFSDLLDQGIVIFLDDILIYSEDAATHFKMLRRVLDIL